MRAYCNQQYQIVTQGVNKGVYKVLPNEQGQVIIAKSAQVIYNSRHRVKEFCAQVTVWRDRCEPLHVNHHVSS
jgi:hypothetical protein